MKHKLALYRFIVVIILLAGSACQEDSDDIRLPIPAEAFKAGSQAADFISRTSLLDGSDDNILDGASCSSIVLPVTVIVNDQEVLIGSTADLKYVERIIDEFDNDEDKVDLVYPVTVRLADYTQVTVDSKSDLQNLVKDCVEGGDDDDIECLDFTYPVKLTLYNSDSQTSRVITITLDEELHDFIHELKDDDYVSFQFPLTMSFPDGTSVTVNDNDALSKLIEQTKGDCDENDDSNFEDDDVNDGNLIDVITNGTWVVEYFFHEGNLTTEFSGFAFTFSDNGSAIAINGGTTVDGSWKTYGDDGQLELDLEFDKFNEGFDEIGEDWTVVSFTTSTITLSHDHESDTLVFTKQ